MTRTIGQFLQLVEKHRDHMWFIEKNPIFRGWGKISLGGYYNASLLYVLMCLEKPKKTKVESLPADDLVIKELRITKSLYRAVVIASTFKSHVIRTISIEGLETISKVKKVLELRRRLLRILKPLR